MAWTHMTPAGEDYWVLPKESYATAALALVGIARGLVNTAGTWVVVEGYSSASAGGAGQENRRIPNAPGNDMDCALFSNGGDFSWQNGNLVAGDWIVLQSTTGGQECQVFLKYVSTTSIGIALIPKADWTPAVGSPGTATPTFPATGIGTDMDTSPTLVNMSVQNAPMFYNVWSDTGTLMFLAYDGTPLNTRFVDVGYGSSSHPDNVYPSTIRAISIGPLGGDFNGIANYRSLGLDGTTLKTMTTATLSDGAAYIPNAAGYDGANNKWQPFPTATVAIGTAAPYVTWLKRYVVSVDLGISGTLASKRYAYWRTAAGTNAVCILWDDTTDVP